jgi:hypothetical protein
MRGSQTHRRRRSQPFGGQITLHGAWGFDRTSALHAHQHHHNRGQKNLRHGFLSFGLMRGVSIKPTPPHPARRELFHAENSCYMHAMHMPASLSSWCFCAIIQHQGDHIRMHLRHLWMRMYLTPFMDADVSYAIHGCGRILRHLWMRLYLTPFMDAVVSYAIYGCGRILRHSWMRSYLTPFMDAVVSHAIHGCGCILRHSWMRSYLTPFMDAVVSYAIHGCGCILRHLWMRLYLTLCFAIAAAIVAALLSSFLKTDHGSARVLLLCPFVTRTRL